MPAELRCLAAMASLLVVRLRTAHHERGAMTTETVIITALLATLAIAATAIIVNKVIAKANAIPMQ